MGRFLLLLLIVAAAYAAPGCAPASGTLGSRYPRTVRPVPGTASVVFVSDTQTPIWVEKLLLEADDNEEATREIFDAVSRDSTCAAMFHLGDLTPLGGVSSDWEEFDRNSLPLRAAGVPIFPAYGNHDYLPREEDGIANMVWRFPFLSPSWYTRRVGPLAVVLLNSNFARLTPEEASEQERWYQRTLDSLDADTTVAAVIVGCHHPPYTNSTVVRPSDEVGFAFVPPFVKSRKTRLFVSGHAHAFEHFTLHGKDFMVIGGGGGLLHPLLTGAGARWPDRVPHESNRSFFHYVRIVANPDRLTVESFQLNPGLDGFGRVYSIDLPSNVSK